ncbi:MAG: FTR1 family iron permease [Chloroflexi bacterium]|jgi:high-affinity iron transporter|nr:FTR1 family iron permease [Chloroflexota bacterium]
MLDPGALTSGFVVGLREGVEAALLVAIVCAYLARTGNARHFPKVWLGTGAAVAASAVAGLAIYLAAGGLAEPWEQLFEAAVMLVAAAVVTWMLFWMRRQASHVRGALHGAIDRVHADGTAWGLALLAFSAVIREGLETALFLSAQATAIAGGAAGADAPLAVLLGAVGGLLVAVAIGVAFYRGSQRLDLGRFLRWTGVLLVFVAAGLVSHAVHELVDAGVVTVATQTLFNMDGALPDDEGIGLFLRALFGYSSSPELVTVLAWLAYVGLVLPLYLRPLPARRSPVPPEEPAGPKPGPEPRPGTPDWPGSGTLSRDVPGAPSPG